MVSQNHSSEVWHGASRWPATSCWHSSWCQGLQQSHLKQERHSYFLYLQEDQTRALPLWWVSDKCNIITLLVFQKALCILSLLPAQEVAIFIQGTCELLITCFLSLPISLSVCLWQSRISIPALSSFTSLLPWRCGPPWRGVRPPGVRCNRLPLQQHTSLPMASCLPLPVRAPARQCAGWCGLWKWQIPGCQPRGDSSECLFLLWLSSPQLTIAFFLLYFPFYCITLL